MGTGAGSCVDSEVVEVFHSGSWEAGQTMAKPLSVELEPRDYWPDLDETLFESGQARRFAAGLWQPLHGVAGSDPELVELAFDLRTTELPADPWSALVALEAERLASAADERVARRRFERDQGIPDPEVAGWDAYFDAFLPLAHLEPTADHAPLLRLSREARYAWPESEVADLATVYELYALGATVSTQADLDFQQLALAVLGWPTSERVRNQVVAMLGRRARGLDWSPADLRRLDRRLFRDGPVPGTLALAAAALHSSLEADDTARALHWFERYETAIDDACTELHDLGPTECADAREERDSIEGWLAAQGALVPSSWQTALLSMVRTCTHNGARTDEQVALTGIWRDGWVWDAWSNGGDLERCIRDNVMDGPQPPPGQCVRLRVLP